MRKIRTLDNTPDMFPGLASQILFARTARKALVILKDLTTEERKRFIEILSGGPTISCTTTEQKS